MSHCAFPLMHSRIYPDIGFRMCGCLVEPKAKAAPLKRTPIKRTRLKPPVRDLEAEAEWNALRAACKNRARGWCQAEWDGNCLGRGTDAHHVLPRGRGGKDELGNLLWVCNRATSKASMNTRRSQSGRDCSDDRPDDALRLDAGSTRHGPDDLACCGRCGGAG